MWEVKRKDGTYLQERVTDDLTGDARIVSVKLKDESRTERKRAREKLEQKIAKGRPKKDKLSNLIRLHQEYQRSIVRESSMHAYISLDKRILETIGDVYLDTLTAGYIKKQLLISGKEPTLLNSFLKRLKTILRWGYMNDIISDNSVYEKLTLFPEQDRRVRIQDKYLEPAELNKLIRETPPSLSLFIRFLSLTGMRVGEAIALNVTDIWNGEIRISKTVNQHTHKIGATKTLSSTRDIHVQPELAECIEDIKTYMEMQAVYCNYQPTPYLFTNKEGSRYNYNTIEKRLSAAGKDILNRDITSHIMRHTHASMLAAAGYPLEAISRRLGHEKSDVTRAIYLHVTQRLKDREASQLDKIRLLEAC